MKLFMMIFLSLFLGKSCSSQTDKQLKEAVLEYTANTRGFYQKITIQNKMLTVSKDREANDKPVATKISQKDWEELANYLKTIQVDSLPVFKAPSQKRFHDGAAIANLKVIINNKTYQSKSFDHGNPPMEIQKLVQKINNFVKKE